MSLPRTLATAATLLVFWCTVHAEEPARRILRAGSAATASYPPLLELAERAGTPLESLDPLWFSDGKEREGETAAKKALRDGTVDVLTLVPLWRPSNEVDDLTKRGFAANPKILVTVREEWHLFGPKRIR
jgi:hypothetical protein